jgi:hypothetical protein
MIVADLGELAQAAGKAVDAAECIKNTPNVAAASACIRSMVMGGKATTRIPSPPTAPLPTPPPPITKPPETPREVEEEIKTEEIRDEMVGANIVAMNTAQTTQESVVQRVQDPPKEEGWFSKYWPYMAGGAGVLVFVSVLAVVTRR